jgi:hypothetical protein
MNLQRAAVSGVRALLVVLLSVGLVVADAAPTRAGNSFGPAALTVSPSAGLVGGLPLVVRISGAPPGVLDVFLCGVPVADTVPDARCLRVNIMMIDDTGSAAVSINAQTRIVTPDGETEVDCRAEPCALAVFDTAGQLVAQTSPLGYGPAPTLTLEPDTGLLEGDLMFVTAHGLLPDSPYELQHCARNNCDVGVLSGTDADGVIHATLVTSQLVNNVNLNYDYCRDVCRVLVSPSFPLGGPPGLESVEAPYAMAAGTLAASPDSGLDDGQQVHLTGAELMPTYNGPIRWIFPTGGWAATQCDEAILLDQTLAGALTHCAAAPTTRGVTINGTTLDSTIDVQATIAKIVGGTTDCTAAPGACVVGLIRFEQDRSLSTHLVPISFG